MPKICLNSLSIEGISLLYDLEPNRAIQIDIFHLCSINKLLCKSQNVHLCSIYNTVYTEHKINNTTCKKMDSRTPFSPIITILLVFRIFHFPPLFYTKVGLEIILIHVYTSCR